MSRGYVKLNSPGFMNPGFQGARLVIDLENGTSVDALEVASKVLEHWRSAIP